jgi:transposase
VGTGHATQPADTVVRFAADLAAKLSEVVDAVRREEVKIRPELKRTRWLRLKLHEPVPDTTRRELHRLILIRPSAQLATARALRWLEDFQAFYDQHPSYAPDYLRRWCYGAKRSRLQPVKDFVTPGREPPGRHHRLAHQPPEQRPARRINSLVQTAKARARGYRNKTKMITISYLTAAKLQLPTLTNPTPAYMFLR